MGHERLYRRFALYGYRILRYFSLLFSALESNKSPSSLHSIAMKLSLVKKYDCARMIEHVSRETITQQRAQRIAIRGRRQRYRCWEQAI